jgi:hypothetical protein
MADSDPPVNLNPYTFLTDPLDIFESAAVPVPPGTKAPPRPRGSEQFPVAGLAQESGQVEVLVARIETALQTIHAALAEIKRIQNKAG